MKKNLLEHLSNEEIKNLMERYYNGENTSQLIEEYDIQTVPSNLYHLFPPIVCKNELCEYCKVPLIVKSPSKTNKNSPYLREEMHCPICGHYPFRSSRCTCKNCLRKAENIRLERLTAIQETYNVSYPSVDFDFLPFESKVYLGAICRSLLQENLCDILPYQDSNAILTPINDLTHEVYTDLIHHNVLVVSPDSDVTAFDVSADNFPNVFYTYRVQYHLNLNYPADKRTLFSEILNPNYLTPDHKQEALQLWRKIAIAECIEYLEYQLKKVHFDFHAGEKTKQTFDIILNSFSVSQVYGIIWKAVADASKLYLERKMSKQHAANTVIGSCERYADRAKIEGWNLVQYNRLRDLPQSSLSEFFFNRVMRIAEKGFRTVPVSLEQSEAYDSQD